MLLIPKPKVLHISSNTCITIEQSGISNNKLTNSYWVAEFLLQEQRQTCPSWVGTFNCLDVDISLQDVSDNQLGDGYITVLSKEEQNAWRKEGYILNITTEGVCIQGRTEQGRFYGLQTLAQIIAGNKGNLVALTIVDWPTLSMRGAHICHHLITEFMPQLAPDFNGMVELLKRFAHFKGNIALLELEAMFPFTKHALLSCKQGFSKEQMLKLVRICKDYFIDPIPLFQALGHAYFVLRHPEHAHLREGGRTTQQYCPSNPEVLEFYAELVDDVLEIFPDLNYFHIGGDESRRLGVCETCHKRSLLEGVGNLYGEHIGKAAAIIQEKGIKPIVWADILEKYPAAMHHLPAETVVDYWNYHPLSQTKPAFYDAPELKNFPVVGSAGVRFGTHNHTMYLLTEAMQGINIMSFQAQRCGYLGHIVTDWMKAVPYELSMMPLAYSFELAWGGNPNQSEFERRFSSLHFGVDSAVLFDAYRAMEKPIPYCEDAQVHLVDRLDRYDVSGLRMGERIAKFTSQDNCGEVVNKLEVALEQGQGLLAELDKEAQLVIHNKREYELTRLSLLTHIHKAKMGLAFDQAVVLLKYPTSDDGAKRNSLVNKLHELKKEWHELRKRTVDLLSEGNLSDTVKNTIDFKFESDALEYIEHYSALLTSGKNSLRVRFKD